MDQICDDLHAEHAALDAVVADISEEMWTTATPAEGWDVKDTIIHLIQADMAASLAGNDPDGFAEAKRQMMEGGGSLDYFAKTDDRTGTDILELWRTERDKMLAAFRSRGRKDRIPWFGPDMSTLSFATARLMETWSHGQDVADTVGADWPATDRLKHVCHIGVTTRGWSYMVRGREVPPGDVRVELTALLTRRNPTPSAFEHLACGDGSTCHRVAKHRPGVCRRAHASRQTLTSGTTNSKRPRVSLLATRRS